MRLLVVIAFALGLNAFGQGLSLRDPAFLSQGLGGSLGAGEGGGPVSPGAPTEYWDMQEGAGNRVGEVSATVMAGPTVGNNAGGLFGNCAQWNSSANLDSVVPGGYNSGDSVSINFWIKFVTNTGADSPVMNFWCESSFNHVISYFETSTSFQAYIFDFNMSNTYDYTDSGYVRDTNWRMISLSYDGGTELLTLFIDGVLKGASSTPFTLGTQASPELDWDGQSGQETTRLDEIYIKVGHAFTEDEVTWLWNSGVGRQFSDF